MVKRIQVRSAVKLVNFIQARELHHHQFIHFLKETDADHTDLLGHSNVRWLHLGKVCQHMWEQNRSLFHLWSYLTILTIFLS